MGWKGKQAFEGGALLLGAVGLVALVVGFLITPDSALRARDVYWGSAMSVVGSVLVASGVATFVVSRMRDHSS